MVAKKTNNNVIKVPEINISFDKIRAVDFPKKISGSDSAAELIRSLFDKGEIEFHEVFFVVYLNRANEPIGYYKHSIGGIAGTVADNRIILGAALKSLSSAIIVSHNHPSGNIKPSESDKQLTKKLQEGARLLDISVLDHIILTKNDYSSLADQGLMGVDSPYPINLTSTAIIQENKIDLHEIEAKAIELELELLNF